MNKLELPPASRSLRRIGVVLGLYGFVLLGLTLLAPSLLASFLPPGARYNVTPPLLFMLIGSAWVLSGRQPHAQPKLARLRRGLQVAALLLPVGELLRYGWQLGRIAASQEGVLTLALPGALLALNSAVAFLVAALCLLWAEHPRARPGRLFACGALVVTMLSLVALAGHFLNLQALYRFGNLNSMFMPTALGLAVVASGLWLLYDELSLPAERALHSHHARIRRRALSLLGLVAISAGIGGFAVLRNTVEATVAGNMQLLAGTFSTMFANTIETRLRLPRSVALQTTVADALADGEKPAARQALAVIGAQLLASGVDGVRFLDVAHRPLSESGRLDGDAAIHVDPLSVGGAMRAELRWRDGYLLRTESAVERHAELVGYVVAEQRLRAVDQVLAERRASDEGADALICSAAGDAAACSPSRFNPAPFRVPMHDADGRLVDLPIFHALAGQAGVMNVRDLRGVPVVGAYAPLGSLGPGLVLKTDIDTLYAPLRQRLQILAVVLIALVMLGAWALAARVRPLLDIVEREQRRIQVILENSQDAFIAIDENGCVTDWNRAAQETFGWTAAEATGQPLATLIFPAEQHERVVQGLRAFAATGVDFFINQRVEFQAIDRHGRAVPLELSAAAIATEIPGEHGTEIRYRAAAFARDISDRLLAQSQLMASEKRLRDITENLPVLISYIDRQERFRFANATFRKWLGVEPESLLGKTMAEVIAPTLHAERKAHLQRALQGHRVAFDLDSEALGRRRSLHTEYIPDVDEAGVVQGIYALTSDVTALKLTETRLIALATQDTLTGLANRHLFNQKLPEAMARVTRSGQSMALMFLDIDYFKRINDRGGHAGGDAVLKEFAQRLLGAVRVTDTVARLAGDEFVIILEGLADVKEAEAVAAKIIHDIARRFETPQGDFDITTSIGIVFHGPGERGVKPDQLLARADQSLYAVKAAGRNDYRVWTNEGTAEIDR